MTKNKIKKSVDIPFITSYKKNISTLLDIEQRITSIYNLPVNPMETLNEYKRKPIIKLSSLNDKSDIHKSNESTDK